MSKNIKKMVVAVAASSFAIVGFVATLVGKSVPSILAEGAGSGVSTLKLTWDFSTSTGTSTTAFTTSTLKTFLESFDSPDTSYTVSATNNTYKGSGSTADSWPDDNWKFSSSSTAGAATITGLPTYGYVKVWAYQWSTDVASLAINDGTAQTISGNAYNLYEFDVVDTTSFKIVAVKRSMIQKIEFWGC